MGSREGVTSSDRDEGKVKAQEKNEAKQKEVIGAIPKEGSTPMPHSIINEGFLQLMKDMEERRKLDLEKQNQFHSDILRAMQERPPTEIHPRIKLVDFLQTRPLSFSIVEEPMEAENWLMDTSRKLKSVGCKDDEKVRYATYLLSGSAAAWWEELKFKSFGEGSSTWAEFKKKFREAYVHGNILKKKGSEVMEQKNLPVMKHVREFNRLSRYINDEVTMEAKRQRSFMKGLQAVMKMQLRIVRAKEFQELVNSVNTLEDDDNEVPDGKRKKLQRELGQVPNPVSTYNTSFPPRNRSEEMESMKTTNTPRSL